MIFLSLGSNIDDRMEYLNSAKKELKERGISVTRESRIYETEPWGANASGDHPAFESGQKWFLNQVIQIETSLSPQELLKVIQEVEKKLGRTQKNHWGPREIDIDILLYHNDTLDLPELKIPHHHMADRRFILEPLTELEPNLKDPISKEKYADILKTLGHEHEVTPFL